MIVYTVSIRSLTNTNMDVISWSFSTMEKAKEFQKKLEYRLEKLGLRFFQVSIDYGGIDDMTSIQMLDDVFLMRLYAEVDDARQDIISDTPMECRLKQLAEEASDLSKASLKVSRMLRKKNLISVPIKEALDSLVEEYNDIIACGEVLGLRPDYFMIVSKLKRWKDRLKERDDFQ